MAELRVPVGPRVTRLLTTTIFRTTNRRRAERSRLMYGLDARGYYLRPLGVLNGLLGIVLWLDEDDEEEGDTDA